MANKKQQTIPAREPIVELAPVLSDSPIESTLLQPAEVDTQSPLITIHDHRDALQMEIAEIEAKKAALQQQQEMLTRQLNRASQQVADLSPQQDTMDAIRAYINGQNESRKARADRRSQLIDLGVQPGELQSAKSPIDQALSQNRKRK